MVKEGGKWDTWEGAELGVKEVQTKLKMQGEKTYSDAAKGQEKEEEG